MKFGKLSNYALKDQDLILDFEGIQAKIEVITPSIINVFCGFQYEEHRSKAIEGNKKIPTDIKVEEKKDGLWLITKELMARVSDGFYVDFFDLDGHEVCSDYRGERKPLDKISEGRKKLLEAEGHVVQEENYYAFNVLKKLHGDEHFYGLGDKTGFLDKRYYDYVMWNTDNPKPQVDSFKVMYKDLPFFITLTDEFVYGIFLDNTWKSYFNMGQESEEYFSFGAAGGNLDYYYIAGKSIPGILQQYTYLTGTCPLPQKWTLGYQQSRWGYVTQEDVQEVADKLREYDIPCDAIHFDIDYMDNYKVFTWNQGNYHNDPDSFLKQLSERGFKLVTINDPGVKKEEGYHIYEEGVEKDYFVKTPEGDVYINKVWPGDSAFPDFGKPEVRTWWGSNLKFHVNKHIRGIWNDMNEPSTFEGEIPDDVIFTDGDKKSVHAEMHNVYGHHMSQATYEGLKQEDGRRPFVITRACYAGSQKYTTVWTGDNHSMWGHLQMAIPQMCNLGLSGIPFAGTDIGGFSGEPTPELMARWIPVGAFSPLFRNHSECGYRRQDPWMFGDEVLEIYRKYTKLRYKLIPYFYDLFFEGEKTGAPIMRPLVYHYEKDEVARTCNDEFMVGDRMLVAPVVVQGMDKRMVYLPEGDWYDYWTREKITGPIWFIKEAPLSVCPIFVKAGSIIPTMEEQSYVGEKPLDTLILDVYPGDGSYDHYLDNGEDFAYRDGKYHQYHFMVDESGKVDCEIVHAGYDKPYKEIKYVNLNS